MGGAASSDDDSWEGEDDGGGMGDPQRWLDGPGSLALEHSTHRVNERCARKMDTTTATASPPSTHAAPSLARSQRQPTTSAGLESEEDVELEGGGGHGMYDDDTTLSLVCERYVPSSKGRGR